MLTKISWNLNKYSMSLIQTLGRNKFWHFSDLLLFVVLVPNPFWREKGGNLRKKILSMMSFSFFCADFSRLVYWIVDKIRSTDFYWFRELFIEFYDERLLSLVTESWRNSCWMQRTWLLERIRVQIWVIWALFGKFWITLTISGTIVVNLDVHVAKD